MSVRTFIDVTHRYLAERTLRAQAAQVEERLCLLHSRQRQQQAIADLGPRGAGECDGGLLVTVADDGAGFDVGPGAPSKPGHLGLVAMRERAELAGGLDLESRPGTGTTVEMWFPMPDAKAESAGPDRSSHPGGEASDRR